MDPTPTTALPESTEPHMAHAATAPPRHGPNHNHPPYAEMIISAIKALNERGGSSRKAIAKFIDTAYTDLPQAHSALLTHHLKRLKNKGHVLMVKHSYKLPKSPSSVPKRGPGRPPKSKPSLGPGRGPLLPKRGRGRPPKSLSVVNGPSGPMSPTRGRGRPPKSKPKTVGVNQDGSGLQKRGRGRPPKPKSITVPSSNGVLRLTLSPKPRGRPKKNPSSSGGLMAPVVVSPGRPRGRPPKNVLGVAVTPGKRRGRPPKVGGVVKPKKASSGRPVGRPKKVMVVVE